MLMYDSKKMMLVNEKGKPLSLSSNFPTTEIYGVLFAGGVFTIPFIGAKQTTGATAIIQGYPNTISFDVICPYEGNLGRSKDSFDPRPTNVGYFSPGTTHFEISMGATNNLFFIVRLEAIPVGTNSVNFTVTNIVLG